jgi:hypothetical protein
MSLSTWPAAVTCTTPPAPTSAPRLNCPAGVNSAVIDAIERPAGYGDDDLAVGRADCNGLAGGDGGAPDESGWLARRGVLHQTGTAGACPSFGTSCEATAIICDPGHPGIAQAVTPNSACAALNPATLAAVPLFDAAAVSPGTTVLPPHRLAW